MNVQKINNNQTFGSLYVFPLSPKSQNLIQPIMPRLERIGTKVDLLLTDGWDTIKRGSDYKILGPCIKIMASKKGTGVFSRAVSKIETIFTSTYTADEFMKKMYLAARKVFQQPLA